MHKSRPTKYTPKLGQLICNKIATESKGLLKLCCGDEGLPCYTTILCWLTDPDKKEFKQNYLLAREAQADLLCDEILEIADEAGGEKDSTIDVSRARLRIDARKWKAAKLAPKKYGDKSVDANTGDGEDKKGNVILWGDKELGV
jgi:hypothetical protein